MAAFDKCPLCGGVLLCSHIPWVVYCSHCPLIFRVDVLNHDPATTTTTPNAGRDYGDEQRPTPPPGVERRTEDSPEQARGRDAVVRKLLEW